VARKQIEGTNPLPDGQIGAPDAAVRPDNKKYVAFGVRSTKHKFYAPLEKYKDLLDVLGLENLDPDNDGSSKDKEQAGDSNIDIGGAAQGLTGVGAQDTGNDYRQPRGGLRYVKLRVKAENGYLTVICDPEKLSTALQGCTGKNIYGKKITDTQFIKTRLFNG
jgi:hypothetical protein